MLLTKTRTVDKILWHGRTIRYKVGLNPVKTELQIEFIAVVNDQIQREWLDALHSSTKGS